ncbi:Protein kinase domain [Trypanosoma vivax]|uniref:Aurora kinase n=1 Tax=Trypanosoma vivax (strain Y486) TaxID=1055687 RepID=G0U3W1_TRYVY|nr:Protein kinase domain [Trypanosoma vivax]CCC50201.1 putative protein kinase [Trypanosoma vivax Y486]
MPYNTPLGNIAHASADTYQSRNGYVNCLCSIEDGSPQPNSSMLSSAAAASTQQFLGSPSSKSRSIVQPPPMWSLEDFEVLRKLDEGRFGKIYLAREKQTKCAVVLKCISKEMIRFYNLAHQLQREVELQEYAGRYNENILRLFAYFWDEERIILVLEYANGGSLLDLLNKRKQQQPCIPDEEVSNILRQLLLALTFLHERDIIHRDVKPDNILFSTVGNESRLRLADFSWAVRLNPSDLHRGRRCTLCGTLDYIAPELVTRRGWDTKSDMWAVGILAYRMICGFLPFERLHPQDVCAKIAAGAVHYPPNISTGSRNFLEGLLRLKESERLSSHEALGHPFIRTGGRWWAAQPTRPLKATPISHQKVVTEGHKTSGTAAENEVPVRERVGQQETGLWHYTGVDPEMSLRRSCVTVNISAPDSSSAVAYTLCRTPVSCDSIVSVSPFGSTEYVESVPEGDAPSFVTTMNGEWLDSVSPIASPAINASAVAVNMAAGSRSKSCRDDFGLSSHGVSNSGLRLHCSASEGSGTVAANYYTQLGASTLSSLIVVPSAAVGVAERGMNPMKCNQSEPSASDMDEWEPHGCVLRLSFEDAYDEDDKKAEEKVCSQRKDVGNESTSTETVTISQLTAVSASPVAVSDNSQTSCRSSFFAMDL